MTIKSKYYVTFFIHILLLITGLNVWSMKKRKNDNFIVKEYDKLIKVKWVENEGNKKKNPVSHTLKKIKEYPYTESCVTKKIIGNKIFPYSSGPEIRKKLRELMEKYWKKT